MSMILSIDCVFPFGHISPSLTSPSPQLTEIQLRWTSHYSPHALGSYVFAQDFSLLAVVNSPGSKTKVPGFKTRIYLSLASFLIALRLSFPICDMGIIVLWAWQYYCEDCFDICEMFPTGPRTWKVTAFRC